jgi:microcystin-dependent protein
LGQQFLGEIRLLSFQFAPKGWAACSGQLMNIQQNAALFSLLGTFYGGDGIRTFGLPDLRGRAPLHMGQPPGRPAYTIGQMAGVENVTLLSNQIPTHPHLAMAVNSAGGAQRPIGNFLSQSVGNGSVDQRGYTSATATTTLNPGSISNTGNNLPHSNQQPYLVMNYCIAIQGIFPSRG